MNALSNQLNIQSGDIIFIAIRHYLYKKVAQATGSKTSHVGIAFIDETGECLVAESRVPFCTYTPLEKFLARSEDNWFYVRRAKQTLTQEHIGSLRTACDERMGKWYHLGFDYRSKRQFCSKFVYDVYKSVLDIEVGELETFEQLLTRRPDTPLLFWKLWFFGFIPWQRLTVTPASQLASHQLETVYCSEETVR